VEVPEGGEAFVDLRPKADGATVVVRLKGPGVGAGTCWRDALPRAGDRPDQVGDLPPSTRAVSGVLTFRAVDEGRYTLLVSCGAGKKRTQVSQTVDVNERGEQTIEVDVPAP
jgi:hypothetical protein